MEGLAGLGGELIRVTNQAMGTNTSASGLARAISSSSSPIYDIAW